MKSPMHRTFPFQLTEKLFVLGEELFPTYLLKGERCALLELGASGSVISVERHLEQLEIDKGQVEHLVVQHAHWDHVCGLPYFLRLFPNATVLGSSKARKVLGKPKIVNQFRENDERWCLRLKENGTLKALPPFLSYDRMNIDVVVEDGQTFELGGVPARFLSTEGHSSCSLSVHLPTERAVLVSDAIGFYLPDVDGFLPMFFQSVDNTLASIDRVMEVDVDILAYGHAPELILQGKGEVVHGCRRIREHTLAMATRIRTMVEAGETEETLLETIHQVIYQDFLTRLYLPEYLQAVAPFLLKSIMGANLPAAA